MITLTDFQRLEIKAARILEVKPHPSADKLYILTVDCGAEDKRELVAGIRPYYQPEELLGKQIIVLTNLQPATIRGIQSNGMLLAVKDEEGKLAILTTDRPVKEGSPVS